MSGALALIFLFKQDSQATPTSEILLKDSRLVGIQKEIAKNHRWMQFGTWSPKATNDLRHGALKLLQWRASKGADDQIKAAYVSNWKSQLKPSGANSTVQLLEGLIESLSDASFPIPKAPQGRWMRFGNRVGTNEFNGQSETIAKRIIQLSASQSNDPNERFYLLLRKSGGNLTGYLQAVDGNGGNVRLDTVKLSDANPSGANLELMKSVFDESVVGSIPEERSKPGSLLEGIPAKKLDIGGIENQGFLNWFHAKVSNQVTWSKRATAILANEMDVLEFLKTGGSYANYLRTHGYAIVAEGNIDLVVPTSLLEAESVHVNEQEMAQIDPSRSAGEIIEKYAKWVDHSGLIASFDRLSYLEGALCWQRDLPLLSENIYPLLPILSHLGRIDLSIPMERQLVGTPAGELGNRLVHERIGDPFVLGPRLPTERRIGYAWGGPSRDYLASVQLFSRPDERVYFKSLLGEAKTPFDLADQLRAYGNNWDSIMFSAAEKPVDVEAGDLVTISFQSASGRVMSGDMFFRRRQIFKGQFKDLPMDRLESIKYSAIAIMEGMDDGKSRPPPQQ